VRPDEPRWYGAFEHVPKIYPRYLRPSPKQNVVVGMDGAGVLTCNRSNEKQSPITCKKKPHQRAGSKSQGLGLGSVQGIQVLGLFGRGRQMDKLLYREEIDGFRQNNPMIVS
jgi:hypothetical protein